MSAQSRSSYSLAHYLLITVLGLCTANTASALLIQVDIDTTIDRLTTGGPVGAADLDPIYSAGDPVQIQFVYDTNGNQTLDLVSYARYDSLRSFSITVGPNVFVATDPGIGFTVSNDRSYGRPVLDDVQANTTSLTGPMAGTASPISMIYAIDTDLLTTFSSTALPDEVALNALIADRRAAGGFISFQGDGGTQQIRFAPFDQTITATVIPEPGTAVLLFLGLGLLGRRGSQARV